MYLLILSTVTFVPRPFGRVLDLAENPALMALWGIALLLLLALPLIYSRLRRRKVRRSYSRNPLEGSTPKQEQKKQDSGGGKDLAEVLR